MYLADLPDELKITSAILAARFSSNATKASFNSKGFDLLGTSREAPAGEERFLFILGSGASASSRIPMAKELVLTWYGEAVGLPRSWWKSGQDSGTTKRKTPTEGLSIINKFRKESDKKLEELTFENAASKYEETFHLLFGDNQEAGYLRLADAMRDPETGRDKRPSIGYSFLAHILAKTPHNLVVTTNFDNLVADALARHQGIAARIYGHEAVIPHVGRIDHPTVLKVHRDLHCAPKNENLSPFDVTMADTLRSLFRERTPVVVGYGGWDRSLMHFLERHVAGSTLRPGVYWCMRAEDAIPDHILRMVVRAQGRFVPIEGFDEAMLELAGQSGYLLDEVLLHVRNLAIETNADLILSGLALNRVDIFSLFGKVTNGRYWGDFAAQSATTSELQKIESLLDQLPTERLGEKANGYGFLGVGYTNKPDYNEKAESCYKRALDAHPKSPLHLVNFAIFLEQRDRTEEAEGYYKRAMDVETPGAHGLCAYANFLAQRARSADADGYYKKAIAAEPQSARWIGAYANFLAQSDRVSESEACYKRAVEAEPMNSQWLFTYANFLAQRSRMVEADEYHKRAVDADPKNAHWSGTYATFLEQRDRVVEADGYYKRAVAAEPMNSHWLCTYANFLAQRSRMVESEGYHKRAVEADPKNAHWSGTYATFLAQRDRADEAEAYFKMAIAANSKNTRWLNTYAAFLAQRDRSEEAEAYFKMAIELDPKNVLCLSYYAIFLAKNGRLTESEEYYKHAVEADPNNANSLANYTQVLFALNKDTEALERLAQVERLTPLAPVLRVELLYYRLAHDRAAWPAKLKDMKSIIVSGVRSKGWRFDTDLRRAGETAHQNIALLEALAAVITQDADIATLERFSVWREVGIDTVEAPQDKKNDDQVVDVGFEVVDDDNGKK